MKSCSFTSTIPRQKLAGFTLIEVLIALGLSVVLLAAVYGSLQMMYRFQSAGKTEIRISQIQRSIIRMLIEDLGSIVLQLPEESGTESSSEQAADSEESSSTSESSTSSTGSASSTLTASPSTLSGVDDSGVPWTFGLVGNAEAFHVTVSKPSRDLAYDSPYASESVVGRMSDLQIVSWGLAPLPADYRLFGPEVSVSDPPRDALGRRALDLLGAVDVDAALMEQDLLAPEITEVLFEYFDGAIWVEEWDSQAYGALPRAIRVTLGFWIEPGKPRGHQGVYMAKPIIHRVVHTVPVPLTIPYVEETGL
jgi:prepilin-type N-terminal cleavage/methylation domain-containing protein